MPGFTSIWHWLVVLVIVVLIFGTKKLRNIGKDLGGAVHDFKKGLNEGEESGPVKLEDKPAEPIDSNAKSKEESKEESKG